MGAAEKVPCPRGGKGVWETHIAEVQLRILNVAPTGGGNCLLVELQS